MSAELSLWLWVIILSPIVWYTKGWKAGAAFTVLGLLAPFIIHTVAALIAFS